MGTDDRDDVAGERPAEQEDRNVDKQAILRRRARFVAVALAGLASCGDSSSQACLTVVPRPCLDIEPPPQQPPPSGLELPPPEGPVNPEEGTTSVPTPCLEYVPEPEEATPRPCLRPIRTPPSPCLSQVAVDPEDDEG
ncbi:MAG: hypothetical protein AAGF12_08945 [Myxococcota bacterium]